MGASQFSASHRCDLQEAENQPSASRCFAVIAIKFIEHQLTARRHPFCSPPGRVSVCRLRARKKVDLVSRARPVVQLSAETPCVFAHQTSETVTEKRQNHF